MVLSLKIRKYSLLYLIDTGVTILHPEYLYLIKPKFFVSFYLNITKLSSYLVKATKLTCSQQPKCPTVQYLG